jgi:hypothetical protein
MKKPSEHHTVRRIVLPSGRSIEVVRFVEREEIRPGGLHVCGRCDSELVQPVAWSEAPGHRWELTLECPNCGWVEVGTYERDQVEALEERLDEGLADMLDDLRRLTQVNMSEEIDRFATALEGDHILPEDF